MGWPTEALPHHSLVKETVLPAREAILKQPRFSLPLQHEGISMTAFISTVSILSAGTLAALLTTDLGAEVALAVIAII